MGRSAFYILVNSTTEGMALHRALVAAGCRVRVAPVPRDITACCGVSIVVAPEDMPSVRSVLDSQPSLAYDRVVELSGAIDPQRDVYC